MKKQVEAFQKIIWDYYKKNKRDFPWRNTTDPYKILISEVMLQQTQTYRVQPKYETWIKQFPDFQTLAKAPLSEVLSAWQGLGYNRRALYLKKIAQEIAKIKNYTKVQHYIVVDFLQELPGIGKNTASAIVVFSRNIPLVFIETNIRRVFIHFFFSPASSRASKMSVAISEIASSSTTPRNDGKINDKQLLPLIKETLDQKNPREWYYALMDYGSMLAKTTINPNRKSKHYIKQSKFEGSLRQVRGKILKIVIDGSRIKTIELKRKVGASSKQFQKALDQLEKEGFILLMENVVVLKTKN